MKKPEPVHWSLGLMPRRALSQTVSVGIPSAPFIGPEVDVQPVLTQSGQRERCICHAQARGSAAGGLLTMCCPWVNVSIGVHSEPEQLTTCMSFSLMLRDPPRAERACSLSALRGPGRWKLRSNTSFTEEKTVTERACPGSLPPPSSAPQCSAHILLPKVRHTERVA